LGASLRAIRAGLPPGLSRLNRDPTDAVVIEEVWL